MSKHAKEPLSAFPSQVAHVRERRSLTATAGRNRSTELQSSPNGEQETKATKVNQSSSSRSDAAVKMTLYISKGIAKEFKKLAIDEELDYSQLAERAFVEFVQNHST